MSAAFEDIAIIDLDLKKTTWSRVHSAMRTLYLRLSRQPEMDWVRFFHEERESRVMIKRHGLWIEEGYIIFDCLLEDVEAYHLPDFRLSMQYANDRYRELLHARQEQHQQQRADERAEQEELAALRALVRGASNAVAPAPPPADIAVTASPPPVEDISRVIVPASDDAAANTSMDDFYTRRQELRARFRAALLAAAQAKESERGNN